LKEWLIFIFITIEEQNLCFEFPFFSERNFEKEFIQTL